MLNMKIDIFIIDPDNKREVPADAWIAQTRAKAIKGNWIVLRADNFPPFMVHKNNMYEKCVTADYYDCAKTASFTNSRLGTEFEWRVVHEAKMHNGLDRIIATIEGDVIGCKPTYTEDGTVVRSYTRDGYMETFDRSQFLGRAEIFARIFRSIAK